MTEFGSEVSINFEFSVNNDDEFVMFQKNRVIVYNYQTQKLKSRDQYKDSALKAMLDPI